MDNTLIICNPGYGNGPYLRCAEVALSLRNKLANNCKIAMPLIYGDKQKRILEEEFGTDHPIIFDDQLGAMIHEISFKDTSYEAWLTFWCDTVDQTIERISDYLSTQYPSDFIEVARSPVVKFGSKRSFAILFARTSDILAHAIHEDHITIDKDLLQRAASKMRELENKFTARFITDPGTFDTIHDDDSAIPLTASLKDDDTNVPEQSVYVSVSGIPHQNLDAIQHNIDLPLYTNKEVTPHVLSNPNIIFQIARAGWGASWMSLLSNTPLITPPYNQSDDPEIFFNNKRIEELGIGLIYNNKKISDLVDNIPFLQQSMEACRLRLMQKYNTLNGAELAAEKIYEQIQ